MRTGARVAGLLVCAAALAAGLFAHFAASDDAAAATPSAAPAPNFLIVLADDQAQNSFKRAYMPHTFADIVDKGTRFRDGVAAPPLCCPDRAGILTGQYPHNHGVFSNDPGYPTLRDQGRHPSRMAEPGGVPDRVRRQVPERLRPGAGRPAGPRLRQMVLVPGLPRLLRLQRQRQRQDRATSAAARRLLDQRLHPPGDRLPGEERAIELTVLPLARLRGPARLERAVPSLSARRAHPASDQGRISRRSRTSRCRGRRRSTSGTSPTSPRRSATCRASTPTPSSESRTIGTAPSAPSASSTGESAG